VYTWVLPFFLLFAALSFGLVHSYLQRHGRSNEQHTQQLLQRIHRPRGMNRTHSERLFQILAEDYPFWLQHNHLELPHCGPILISQIPGQSTEWGRHDSYESICSGTGEADIVKSVSRNTSFTATNSRSRTFVQIKKPTTIRSKEAPLTANTYEGIMDFVGKRESEEVYRQQKENTILQSISDICRPLKEARVLIGMYGPPGSGKTTVTFLSALYGFRAKDLEDLVVYDQGKSKWRMPKSLHSTPGGLPSLLDSISSKTPTSFMLAMGPQGGMLKDPGKSPTQVPFDMFRVMLMPSRNTYTARWKARNPNDRQRNEAVYDRMIGEASERADLVIQNDDCPLSALVDICRGFLSYMSLAVHESGLRVETDRDEGRSDQTSKRMHFHGRHRRADHRRHYCDRVSKTSTFRRLFCGNTTNGDTSTLVGTTSAYVEKTATDGRCSSDKALHVLLSGSSSTGGTRRGNVPSDEPVVSQSLTPMQEEEMNRPSDHGVPAGPHPTQGRTLRDGFLDSATASSLQKTACMPSDGEHVLGELPDRNITKTKLGLLSLPDFVRAYNHKHHKYLEQMRSEGRGVSPSVLTACSPLNSSGVVIMVAGPPGAGKSAIAASAIYHGMHGVETEATSRHAECLETEECTAGSIRTVLQAAAVYSDRLTVLAGGGLATIPFSSKTEFYASDLERRFGKKMQDLFPPTVVRVLMLPSQYCTGKECEFPEHSDRAGSQKGHHTPTQRKMAYNIAVHDKFQRAFDVVMKNDGGCAEAGLVDVCLAVQGFLVRDTERSKATLRFYHNKLVEFQSVRRVRSPVRKRASESKGGAASRCADKSSVDALLGCSKEDEAARRALVRLVEDRALDGQVLLLFSNKDFAPVLINWLALYATFSNTDNYVIISLDEACHAFLSKKKLPSVPIPEDVAKRYITGHSNHILKAKFWGMMTILRYSNVNILYSDTDAVWTRDIQAYIRNEERVYRADILSQRGRHPTIVSKEWGCALNTGILFLRNSEHMSSFFEDVWRITNRKDQHDDQSAMNHALYERKVNWEEPLPLPYAGNTTHVSYGTLHGQNALRVGLLPNFLFQRRCEDGTRTDEVYVLHCHAVRTNSAKTGSIDQQGMFVLRSDWADVDPPADTSPEERFWWLHRVRNVSWVMPEYTMGESWHGGPGRH